MKREPLLLYLRDLEGELRRRGVFDAEAFEELQGHLLEHVERGIARGASREEAEAEAVARFGSCAEVASACIRAGNVPWRTALLATAFLLGQVIAYVDSRPTWDDTGVTAGSVFLLSCLITLSGGTRPWLVALAIGGWIPLHGIVVAHQPGTLLALPIALAGACVGWGLRKVLARARRAVHEDLRS